MQCHTNGFHGLSKVPHEVALRSHVRKRQKLSGRFGPWVHDVIRSPCDPMAFIRVMKPLPEQEGYLLSVLHPK